MSVLLISEISGLFVDTLTANNKYPLRNKNNLPQPIQMQLSKKMILSFIFCFISKIYIKFWTFWKEDKAHSLVVKDSRYRRSFDSQNVKEIETLLNISRPTFIILLYNSGKNSVKKYLS